MPHWYSPGRASSLATKAPITARRPRTKNWIQKPSHDQKARSAWSGVRPVSSIPVSIAGSTLAHLGRNRRNRRYNSVLNGDGPMPAVFRPRRSLLYMPGSNPRSLEKARSLPADGLIIDLEDAVAAD